MISPMEDGDAPPLDPQISQAETLAGEASAFRSHSGSHHIPAVPEFPVKEWDRYEFLGFLGQGGMGMVFLGRDRKLGREVAIKFVRIDGDRHLQRFMVEARAQARVDHEHVCKVFEVGEVEGRVFITMQHIAGSPLDVAAPGLSLEQKVIVLRDAARGVHEAHRLGIIHRDLKPSNIMVERAEDGSLKTFVMDFGLAREWDQDVTETGSVLGTPAYMSPEQARGEIFGLDRRSDVYSLGATLYHMITGRPPVSGANALEVLSAIASEDVRSMRALGLDISRDLEAITLKCLEKERSRRYGSANALADDLDRFLAGEPVLARPAGLIYRTHRRFMKHKALAITGTVAVVLVLMALGVALKTRRDASRRERLAQQFTESMGHIESMARYSALAPLHDIRSDLKTVRAHMVQLQEEMGQAGALANGPGHYALGRGYLTLDDAEKAREYLQMAWDAGFREPRVAYALAVVVGRRYQEKLLEAERIAATDQREARKRDIETTLRAPALAYLRQARGSDAPASGYLEALMAFYEGHLDEALERLRVLENDLSWFYEAPLLRGSLLQARAWKRWNQGDRDAAHADFAAGRVAIAAATNTGRSAPAVYAALAELELNALIMEKYGQGEVEPAFQRGMAAVDRALLAQPGHTHALIIESGLYAQLADIKTSRGEDAERLVQASVSAATKALEAGRTRVDAWIALGMAYYQWGNARQDRDLDPVEQLASGLRALETISTEKRDYTVENHIGLIHQTWSEFEGQHGRDPSPHLNGAIEAYRRATWMEPHLLPAWINLGACLQQRATLPRATSPEGDLQEALKVLDEATRLNPKHFVPYFVRGKALFSQALRKRDRGENPEVDLKASVEANRLGIAINSGIPHLHNGLGLAELQLARTDWETGKDPNPRLALALEAFHRSIAIAPNQVWGYLNAGDLLVWKARRGGGLKALREAAPMLQKALKVSPGNKDPLINLGHAEAARVELGLHSAGNPAADVSRGEATLARALALDPRDIGALQGLGQVRSAEARWKAWHHQAERKDFDKAMEPLDRALDMAPDAQDVLLSLAGLYRSRAEWERMTGLDPGPSLRQGRILLDRLTKARPHWGEALAMRGSLDLEEAERLSDPERAQKARKALQVFDEAFAVNRNLAVEWKATVERAEALAKAAS